MFGVIQIVDVNGKGKILRTTCATYKKSLEIVDQFSKAMLLWKVDPFLACPSFKKELLEKGATANLILVDGDVYHLSSEIADMVKTFDQSEFLGRKCEFCIDLSDFVKEFITENFPDELKATKK